MPIIVNLDVMMAKRKVSLGELESFVRRACRAGGPYSGKPFHPEDRKSQSGALLHAGSHLQGTELPARRHTGIPGGRRVILY